MVKFAWLKAPGSLVVALFTLAVATGSDSVGEQSGSKGAVVLTVAGNIAKSNRGPTRGKRDGFLKYQDISFEKAFTFDRAMLDALKQGTVNAQPPQYSAPAVFTGPFLSEVLARVGAEKDASIEARALDGYVSELSAENIASRDWILATRYDGEPFALGGLGPIWLMHKPSAIKVPEEEEQTWPWALFYIEVKK